LLRLVIAGGAGFIGSHLSRRYARDGHQVIVIDNLISAPLWNIDLLNAYENIRFIKHDVCQPIDVDLGPIDAVINLACPASPVDFGPKVIEILRVCSDGVFNLLELARRNTCRFLQASTSECYGDPEVTPQPESYWGHVNPIGVRSCYDEGKRFAEAAVMAYHRKYGLATRIARIFNTYGPDMRLDDGRVLSNFICQAMKGEPLTIYGDGGQTRSFCYVDDLVEGLVRLLECDYSLPVNLGNPEERTIRQLADEVVRLTSSSSKIAFHPLPSDDPKRRRPDIDLARKLLNWQPQTDRMRGIRATVDYFRARLDQPDE
jgi:dTDP-glucose 4,6-dehydratase